MQTEIHQLKKLSIFLLVGTVIFWARNGHAFEPWNAETTATVNLRKSPGLDGKIITSVTKGEIGLINAKNGGWYQIMLEHDTYGYKGWLYGKYLKRVNNKAKSGPYPFKQKNNDSQPVNESTINTPAPKNRSIVKKTEKTQLKQNQIPEPIIEESPSADRYEDDEKGGSPIVNLSSDMNQDKQQRSFNWIFMIGSSMTLLCFTVLFFYRNTQLIKTNQDLSTQLQRIKTKIGEKKAPFKEKRLHPRKFRSVEVDFVVQDRAYWGSIRNVSTGGAYIETRDPFSSGQKIVLTFPCPGTKEHVKKTGEILWTDASGIGVKFKAIPKSERTTSAQPAHLQ